MGVREERSSGGRRYDLVANRNGELRPKWRSIVNRLFGFSGVGVQPGKEYLRNGMYFLVPSLVRGVAPVFPAPAIMSRPIPGPIFTMTFNKVVKYQRPRKSSGFMMGPSGLRRRGYCPWIGPIG